MFEDDNVDESDGELGEDDTDDDNVDESDGDGEEQGLLRWKSNLSSTAAEAFKRRQGERINYRKLIYRKDADKEEAESEDELGGLFKILKQKSEHSDRIVINSADCSKFTVQKVKDWEIEEVQDLIKDCFVTGEWEKTEDATKRLQQDDELYGDFEDLETGEVHQGESESDENEDNKAPEQQAKLNPS